MADDAKSPATPTEHFLRLLFKKLPEAGVSYAVLRNYEGLPAAVDHDVDLLVSDLGLCEDAVRAAVGEAGWTLVRKVWRYSFQSFYCCYVHSPDLPIIQLDAWSPFTWKGMVLISPEVLRRRHQHPNGFDILSPGAEAAVSLIKNIVYHGEVQEKYKPLIPDMVRGDRASFFQALEGPFGADLTERLFLLSCRADWDGIEALAGALRRTLSLRALGREPLAQLKRWLAFLRGHVAKFFRPSGMFVVLIGPDGSGKSTVAQGLQQSLGQLFAGVRYYHGHFEILPRLRDLTGRLGLAGAVPSTEAASVSPDSATPERRFGILRSAVYLFYYGLDYLLGHPVIFRARGKGELVIFDRYYYDYLIQPGMSLPPGLMLAGLKLIPQPDLVIYLKNDPETILGRKGELSREELERQGRVCRELIHRLPQGRVVETGGLPEETTAQAAKLVAAWMVNRKTAGD